MRQDQLATAVNRSASWVSQVERGIQPVVRLDVLQLLADGLGVSVQTLRPDAPSPARSASTTSDQVNDLDLVRLALSGHPALDAVLDENPAATSPDTAELAAAVAQLWHLTHNARFAELSTAVADTLPRLEAATRTASLSNGRNFNSSSARHIRRSRRHSSARTRLMQPGWPPIGRSGPPNSPASLSKSSQASTAWPTHSSDSGGWTRQNTPPGRA